MIDAERNVGGRPRLVAEIPATKDPKEFLILLMNDTEAGIVQRLEAAKILMPYYYQKLENVSKKDGVQEAVKKAMSGRFAPGKPPKLATVSNLPMDEN